MLSSERRARGLNIPLYQMRSCHFAGRSCAVNHWIGMERGGTTAVDGAGGIRPLLADKAVCQRRRISIPLADYWMEGLSSPARAHG